MSEDAPIFRRPDGRELEPWHHLSMNPRRKYVLRLTVDMGPKVVGKRIVQQLRTGDPTVALEKRDAVIEFAKLAGMICRDVEIIDPECRPKVSVARDV